MQAAQAAISRRRGRRRRAAFNGEQLAGGWAAFVAAFGDAMMLSLGVAPTHAVGVLVLKALGVNVL